MGTSGAKASSATAGLVLAGMTLANAMILVDQTAVPLTLPEIMRSFDIGTTEAQWVLTASLVSLAGLLVLGGRLGDVLGRRRVFLVGAVLFASASAAAGLAPDFYFLVVARVIQGAGGALMLPCSVAIVSAAFSSEQRGRALGTMGGVAAVAGALGPTIGGVLTSAISWRAVLLVNVPIAASCLFVALRSVPADDRPEASAAKHVDALGGVLLCFALVGLVLGLTQTQTEPLQQLEVVVPLAIAVAAAIAFVWRERRARQPLVDFALFRRSPDYLGGTLSQGLAGIAEMGLGALLPALLILNLQMSPALAGLALIPTTVPMVVLAPIAGRWYDRVGGKTPLAVGFAVLAAAGVALTVGVQAAEYAAILPGLLLYGIGLALVLTVNDPVSLDMVPETDHGQASGVSATAEQGGGAIGIALLTVLFHTAYTNRLSELVEASPLRDLDAKTAAAFKASLEQAEQTGLNPDHFDPSFIGYLSPAQSASELGFAVAFLAVSAFAIAGVVVVWRLVRRKSELDEQRADEQPAG